MQVAGGGVGGGGLLQVLGGGLGVLGRGDGGELLGVLSLGLALVLLLLILHLLLLLLLPLLPPLRFPHHPSQLRGQRIIRLLCETHRNERIRVVLIIPAIIIVLVPLIIVIPHHLPPSIIIPHASTQPLQ